ncbi:MAG TPA: BPTI/Kunitz-type proteinase inhibitor domain-containing protein [Polyangiaceae bacterium]|nr:BPTI/Kunitz-type proteinase inhibitor domain-containing protein [Polyangiaceae bacterium]
MSKLAIASRIAVATLLLGTLQGACGGQSFSSGGDPQAGSGNEAGSNNTGGTSSTGGTHTTAGKGHGGSSIAGTGSGGTSVGGTGIGGDAGAGSDDGCTGPAVGGGPGGCTAALPNWWHDATTGLCMPIIYGGCGATRNNYKTFEECQKACPGGNTNFDACKLPTDCTLAGNGCCGVCDSPNVTQHDFISYNKAYVGKVSTCAGDVACGACPPPDANGTLKYFVPDCVQGQCAVDDLRTSTVTACKTDQDCTLRTGHGCCPSCNPAETIAVRNDGSFEDLVCGGIRPPCAACLPVPDDNAVAVCGANGHCQVAYVAPAAGGATP